MTKKIEPIDNGYNVFATPLAKRQMELYANLCEDEIGWMCSVTEHKNKNFLIEKCYLLKQETNAATTEIDPQGLLELWNELSEEEQKNLRGWGHSHVNMSTSASGQDDSQMKDFSGQNTWFVRIINNKKGEWGVDLFDYLNGIKVSIDELPIYYPGLSDLHTEIQAEIKEKVSKKVYKSSKASKNPMTSYYKSYYEQAYKSSDSGKTSKYYEDEKKELIELFDGLDINIKVINKLDEAFQDQNYYLTVT